MTIVLTQDWHKGSMARAIPGASWDGDAKAWTLSTAEPRSASVALRLFPDLAQRHPEMVAARDQLMADVRPFDFATPWVKAAAGIKLHAPRVRAVLDGLGWELHEFQEVDLVYTQAVLSQRGAGYLGWERGLGKTLGTCCLIDATEAERTLIVAPNTAKDSVWGSELRRFCPWLEVIVLGNTVAQRRKALSRVDELTDTGQSFAFVIHYEALALIAGKTKKERPDGKTRTELGRGWDKLGIWDLLVADESHRLANTKAQMFKGYKKVHRAAMLDLSGSIIQHNLEELYSPHHRAWPKTYRSKWRDWNDRFLDYAEGGYGKLLIGVKEDKIDTLREELGSWMVYRRKEDELDLPPKTYVERRVDLTPAQRKAYDQLRDECLTMVGDTSVKAQEGIAMLTKLRQIATGLDLVAQDTNALWTDSSKLDAAVEDVLDAPDSEFVIFSWYKAGVHSMAARLETKGVECFSVTGDTPQSERAHLIDRFQGGEGRVFIGTLATLGESVNLQRANQVIRLDRSWNPMLNVQAEDRVFRMGQTRNVTITDYIAKDTVDELVVLPNLATKLALRAAILGGA